MSSVDQGDTLGTLDELGILADLVLVDRFL